MDSYCAFIEDEAIFFGGGLFAPPAVAAAARESAFQWYNDAPRRPEVPGSRSGGGGGNIHGRVMGVLERMGSTSGWEEEEEELEPQPQPQRQQPGGAVESSRGFRHMMRERHRREKLSQSYADLYAMVSSRSKGDKNSIVQSAAIYIHELNGARDQLQRRSEELKDKILGHDAGQQCVKVQFEVDEPSSSIDSMIGALRCLSSMKVKTRGIRSNLSGHTLTTKINVETTIAACQVEQAVEEALREVERNHHHQQQEEELPDSDVTFPGGNGGWSKPSHVQNVF